ncbi:MAG: alcohol dehydrogenase catalytic domain-containing protein, partial [Saccharothrix sp.]|nr:alcohol dehydrogenase catalytic domain-containing protein [Saccharothrix sp.]
MRAIRLRGFGPAEALEPVDVEDPRPGPGQVRIAVRAAGVQLVDTAVRRGAGPWRPELPVVPGSEVTGVVDAVGAGVPDGWLGRR